VPCDDHGVLPIQESTTPAYGAAESGLDGAFRRPGTELGPAFMGMFFFPDRTMVSLRRYAAVGPDDDGEALSVTAKRADQPIRDLIATDFYVFAQPMARLTGNRAVPSFTVDQQL
jgi:hypothetical protein